MENPNAGWSALQFFGDRTWDGRAWTKLDSMMPRPGAGPLLAEPLREPFKNQAFGAILGVVLLLPFSLWTLTALMAYPLQAGMQLAVLLPLLAWSLYVVLKTHTRRVCFDERGLSDTNLFGVRRLPWSAVKGMELINLNDREQRRHDRLPIGKRPDQRPDDNLGAWDIQGAGGVAVLRLYKSMEPQAVLSVLRERIARQLKGTTDAEPAPPVSHAQRVLDPGNPADRKLIEEHDKVFSPFQLDMAKFENSHKRAERGVKVFMLLIVFGLLAGTGYLAVSGMWDEAMLLGGIGLFVGLLAWVVWRGTMRKAKP